MAKSRQEHISITVLKQKKASIEKRIWEINDLLTGDWLLQHTQLQAEVAMTAIKITEPSELLAYMKSQEPLLSFLEKKVRQSKNTKKILRKESELRKIKAALEEAIELLQEKFGGE